MARITVVGMGPGARSMMTDQALSALDAADVIIGYTVYLELLGERYSGKELLSTPMKQEVERCRMCFEQAELGKNVVMICSGDAGIYGMASLMIELAEEKNLLLAEAMWTRYMPSRQIIRKQFN